MANFISLLRRFPANHFVRILSVSGALYGVYLVYVGINLAVVSHGLKDPVYLITGITRTNQFVGVTVGLGTVVIALLVRYLMRDGRPLDFASSPAVKRGTILLMALLLLNSLSASLAAVLNGLSSQFWAPLFAWVAAVLALQILIVYGMLSRVRQSSVHLGLMAALSGFNLLALYLTLVGQYLSLPDLARATVVAFTLLCFGMLFAVVGKRIVPVRSVNAVLVLTMIGPVAALALSSPATRENANRMAPFSNIEFRAKPNIHIVSVDSLSPSALSKNIWVSLT